MIYKRSTLSKDSSIKQNNSMINHYRIFTSSNNCISQQEEKEAQKTEQQNNMAHLRNEKEIKPLSLTDGTTL